MVTGEFSPEAIFYEQDLIQQIYQSYPNLKLIVGLRNPFERDLSSLNRQLNFHGYNPKNPHDLRDIERLYEQMEKKNMYFYNYLPNWLSVFPLKQFFFYDFQEIRRNPQQLLEKTCDFINVPYVKNSGYLMFNPTQHEHGMRSPVIKRRMSIYQSYRITQIPSPIW